MNLFKGCLGLGMSYALTLVKNPPDAEGQIALHSVGLVLVVYGGFRVMASIWGGINSAFGE